MKPYGNVVPKLLIGLDHGHLGLPLRTRRFAREGPYAAATELGWVVFGPVSGQSTTPSPRSCLLAVSMEDTMEKMVEDYFEMESFGVKLAPQVAASDDARAQRILEDTTVKVGRRYQTGLLFHFREGAVGVCGDIKEMFHQVLIRPEDRCSQRFLWRDSNDDRDPDVYEMNVMTFRAACSPSTAHYVKTLNALKFRDSDPRAVKAIIDHHYVDDYVDSFATESEAIEVSTRVKEIHAEAGFELCQFSSSSPIVEAALGPPGRVKSVGWGEAEQKILGMRWQVATDDFRFNVKYHRVPESVLSGDRVPTKREYSSLLMSTFDPLGFLCCLMITAKLLLREIWRQKIQWDEPLPEEIGRSFAAWRRQMDAVGQFRCPRHYFGRGAVRTIKLHVFVDASQSAFAAVAYWRVMYEDGNVLASFVCAKTKCAPMRTMSIPRLELQAAVLGTRLINTVKEEHSVDISETVLRWIGSTHRRYKQFVGNRVAEILKSSKRFSSFSRLVRTTAWVLRFARWCHKQRSELEEYGLTAKECEAAENLLVRQAQLESFPDEMRSAERGKEVATSSEVRGLAPYVDEHGVLRVYGRVDAALCMPYSARRPVVLSHRHSLTELVVRHFHAQMKHQNVDAMIVQIRTRFWVTKMRRVLKEVISSCNECKLQRTRPMPPIMAPLPEDRLEVGGWPFKYTGLDYFGPLLSLLIEAENVVNSRTLTHLPVDADQEAPFTPNDLLKGAANLPNTSSLDAELPKEGSTQKQRRIARMLRDRFWRRWVLEYLPTLVRREKWCRRREPIRQGDMVFVCDPALPRREWRKGIVEEVYSGADGVVRRARMRVNDNGLSRTMLRPVSKLAVLDLSKAVLHGVGDVDGRTL
ncbi:uncharacterized protein [Drosophila kikkawai]|uniref:Integrase zinc-binding domain-containing protein n=1 Tax=Drosophila kikkawai TaxID=30033 RepID=A0ABM4GHY3_DROKI